MIEDATPLTLEKHASLEFHSTEHVNGGPPLASLGRSAVTSTDEFFVRNHGDVPELDPLMFSFGLDGLVAPARLTLADLRRAFPRVTRPVTVQCAGNRRGDLSRLRPVPGELPWESNAISTAVWGGVPLAALLAAFPPAPAARHAAFEGADTVEREGRRFGFGGSIPLECVAELGVLLADEMNGEPLPPLHGGPLRVIVPGVIGARSVKWLRSINLQAEPSANYFQRQAYRWYLPGDAAPEGAPMLHELAVNAVLCSPADRAVLPAGRAALEGYAVAGGSAAVAGVEVSFDDGERWQAAELDAPGRPGLWSHWRLSVDLRPGIYQCLVRAADTHGRRQPRTGVWNAKGYLYNGWHSSTIVVLP
ncbi:MAG TPA: molybdopterin-dependent oxidoreductase [Herpetosiphonaceae bacterium]|nr:molybdopterin-dependent oxidoreductase [Herpetosiphonaceae bacterium]